MSWKYHRRKYFYETRNAVQIPKVCYYFFLFFIVCGELYPYIEYCCHTWDNSSSLSQLDDIQGKSIRFVSYTPLYSDLQTLLPIALWHLHLKLYVFFSCNFLTVIFHNWSWLIKLPATRRHCGFIVTVRKYIFKLTKLFIPDLK